MVHFQEDLCDPLRGFRSGDRVWVIDGTFKGYEVIFDRRLNGENRVQILLEWLGRQVRIHIEAQMIEEVHSR